MALICDTSGVLALYDASNDDHAATAAVVEAEAGDLLVPVVLLAEIDYLLHNRLGADAARDFVRAIEREEFKVVPFEKTDIIRSAELLDQYHDLEIGLADATVVATAERFNIFRLLSFDHRHFRAIVPRNTTHFILLPADADSIRE
ncbi:MAG TPA: PIN domain-containing protein [Pirellulales bacterium]|nr:PIN domain-containing protein [Pirellulales bacterium]